MDYFNYPVRKQYKVVLAYKVLGIPFTNTIFFDEASIMETLEFMQDNENKVMLQNFTGFLKKNGVNWWVLKQIRKNLVHYMEIILPLRYPYVFTWKIAEKSDISDNGNEEKRNMPFCALIHQIASENKMDVQAFIQQYTFTQMEWIRDWMIYNGNELTEKGKKINDRKYGAVGQIVETDDELKARLALLPK